MHKLIQEVILKHLNSPELAALDDAAEIRTESNHLAFTTDSFVVKPIFFPGGDIGSLAVSGTVNDLLMKGARPLHLSVGLIIEEGFPLDDLERILISIKKTCEQAKVTIATGDTKVVGKGEADGLYINTSGIGEILSSSNIKGTNAKQGDVVIVSGDIGAHGVAVMTKRNGLELEGDILSDAAPLTNSVLPLLQEFGSAIHVLRDPTRGGVGTTLNEIASASKATITIDESKVPVTPEVQAVSDLLGFDTLYLPCEGRFLAIVENSKAENIVTYLKQKENCDQAAIIGQVEAKSETSGVMLKTLTGGKRILDLPVGELLPRIC